MALAANKIQDILNYGGYYSAGDIEYGIHGPDLVDGTIYISVYHFLQFSGKDPRNYDTFKMGKEFTGITSDYKKCKYVRQNFEIGKYSFELLEKNMKLVEQFKKQNT